MIRHSSVLLAVMLALGASSFAVAAERVWHPNLEKGVAAARVSGKPILVVTAWKSGI